MAEAAPHKPYVADDSTMAEFTPKSVLTGALFGLIFGASTVYLALKAGLTVSASIPIAVLSISLLKKLGGSTILENNIVQTIGSAGESIAAPSTAWRYTSNPMNFRKPRKCRCASRSTAPSCRRITPKSTAPTRMIATL